MSEPTSISDEAEAWELTDAEIDQLGQELDNPNQVYKLDSLVALVNEFIAARQEEA